MAEIDGCKPSEIDVRGLCIPKAYKDSNKFRVINLSNKLIEIYKQRFSNESQAEKYVQSSPDIKTEFLIEQEKEIYRKILRETWNPQDVVFTT